MVFLSSCWACSCFIVARVHGMYFQQVVSENVLNSGFRSMSRCALHMMCSPSLGHTSQSGPAHRDKSVNPFVGTLVRDSYSDAVQVEHTVTEEVMGVDLVQAQIRIAGGARLSDIGLGSQKAVGAPLGYSIQCRITTEDPTQNFQV